MNIFIEHHNFPNLQRFQKKLKTNNGTSTKRNFETSRKHQKACIHNAIIIDSAVHPSLENTRFFYKFNFRSDRTIRKSERWIQQKIAES